MKKLLLFLVLCFSVSLQASETSIANGIAHAGSDGRAILKFVFADWNGNTAAGVTINGTFTLSAAETAALTNTAALTVPLYMTVTNTAITLNSTTWFAVNVSTYAGTNCYDCRYYWGTYSPAGLEWSVDRNHLLTPTAKFFTAMSVTASLDDGFTNGEILKFRGTGDMYLVGKSRTAK